MPPTNACCAKICGAVLIVDNHVGPRPQGPARLLCIKDDFVNETPSPTVYWAAPLFTDAEREWNATQVARMRAALPRLQVLVPQEFCAPHEAASTNDAAAGRLGKPDFGAIFRDCRHGIDQAQMVVAVLDGPDADSGTAWEMGYAHARGKTIIGLRSDWRPAEDGGGNAMLTRSCAAVCARIDEVIERLGTWLRIK